MIYNGNLILVESYIFYDAPLDITISLGGSSHWFRCYFETSFRHFTKLSSIFLARGPSRAKTVIFSGNFDEQILEA